MAAENQDSVAVIGAGPVGLFTALILAQSGIETTVCEANPGIDQSPRAVSYFPPVLEEFAKAGIVQDVINAGEKNAGGCDWKDPRGTLLAGINPPPNDPGFAVCLSQPELGEILLKNLLATGHAEILFNETFQRLEQDGEGVTYWTKNLQNDQETARKCRYLIGADGGRSTVRRSLGIEFQGITFDSLQFVAVNFQYPLRDFGWKAATFIVDPIDWGIVVKRGKGTSWRFATGVQKPNTEKLNTLDDVTIQLVKDRLSRIIPGDTSKIEYEALAPYTVHQRCATDFRKGRVLLAGDAAHVNNPVGGLGLTAGLLDAAHLAKALREILIQQADPKILTTYAETRRRIYLDRAGPASAANLYRLCSQEPPHIEERAHALAQLNNPKDFINMARIGLADFSLTSTSDKIFDTSGEVTWFISVTRIPDWTEEKFRHEYKVVHANMTRKTAEHAPVIRRYVQLQNSTTTIPGAERPPWDYVTCLTWPSLFIVHAGFKNPGYRATAGAHIFCRLDQEGCLVAQVAKFSKGRTEDKSDVGAVQSIIFHKRTNALDEFSEAWFTKRAASLRDLSASDDRILTYILWRDVTPKNTEHFFHDTQFSGGSWNQYKAVETFAFADEKSAASFFEQHGDELVRGSTGPVQTVIGEPDVII
ncbi:FAD binding domain-containing protein [Bisporella sp. PMI_857]|nr:FAD binding domain-containing protein [Bisporella sp. PMI_857]